MTIPTPTVGSIEKPAGRFPSTAWSVVARAAATGPLSRPAIEDLCQAYWYPLYAYHRRHGAGASEAEDAVQSFFAHLLEKNLFQYATPERGRFRGFLVASFRQFLARRHEYETARKRCPAGMILSLDTVTGEDRYRQELAAEASPDRLFEYTWALTVLEQVMLRLRNEFAAEGKSERFLKLQGVLTGQSESRYPALAESLGLTVGALRVAIHRLRHRFQRILIEEVSATLDEGESVENEIRTLMTALELGRKA